jgi:hypothetical protein
MKVQIPNELKQAMPQTFWGRLFTATPVMMAVLATMLAGLTSSEMTRAQYDRSLAAQQQSKAGDQWNFFQAKRLRSATYRNTLDLLHATTELGPLSLSALKQSAIQLPIQVDEAAARIKNALQRVSTDANAAHAKETLDQYLQADAQRRAQAQDIKTQVLAILDAPDAENVVAAMQKGELPDIGPDPALDEKVTSAIEAVASSRTLKEVAPFIASLDDKCLEDSLRAAMDRTATLDGATKPINQSIDRLEKLLARQMGLLREAQTALALAGANPKAAPSLNREFTAARIRYTAARYDSEARLNQAIGDLYELQVRRSNLSAERHHSRSQRFFYGMLAAQMAVIVSTLAIAAQKRNLLWSIAAGAGMLAVAFGAYVYLFT